MIFGPTDYAILNEIVFAGDYSGYKPEVREAPNGDGKIDSAKRYAHIAEKYLGDQGAWVDSYLRLFLRDAHREALRVAKSLGVPSAFMPDIRYGALRVLEYPVGAGSAEHTDFDLFTILCYRNDAESDSSGLSFEETLAETVRLSGISHGLHMGEIGEIVGLGRATPHAVDGRDYVQHSIVYFAIPDHAAVLPTGVTVGEWIAERIARSRY